MQATVHRFDPGTNAGSVVTDDGLVIPFAASAFHTSGLRHLRVGQRLTIELDGTPGAGMGAGQVRSMRLGTAGQTPPAPSAP